MLVRKKGLQHTEYLIFVWCTLNKQCNIFTELSRLLFDLWYETGSSSVAIWENATQTFPEMMKVQLQHQHLFCVCPVPVEMAVSVEDNQWRDRWLCHFVSSRKTFLLICSSTLTGEMEKVSVCCWQNYRKVTRQGVVPSVLVITSLWASLLIPSIPEASNGKWLKTPPFPILKDLLQRLVSICDMQSIGPEPVKSLLILFCSLFKLCKHCSMTLKTLPQSKTKWR